MFSNQHGKLTLNDTCKVSEIEQIVRLGRGWQKIFHCTLVYHHCRRHNAIARSFDFRVKTFGEVPVCDSAEDVRHDIIVKLVDGDGVEVAQEARSDWITPSPWGAHRSNQQRIH